MKDVLQLVREGKSWEAKVVEDCGFEELLQEISCAIVDRRRRETVDARDEIWKESVEGSCRGLASVEKIEEDRLDKDSGDGLQHGEKQL